MALLAQRAAGCGGDSNGSAVTFVGNDGNAVASDEMAPGLKATQALGGNGEKPISVPGAYPRKGQVPLLVHFFDDGSYDVDGDIVKWEWKLAAGGWIDTTDTKGDIWHTYTQPGNRTAILRVTDNSNKKGMASVMIEMRESTDFNANPVAVPSAVPTAGNAPLTVDFSAEGSYDPDGSIVKFEWDFDEGAGFEDFTAAGGITSHLYASAGNYTATLRVTDNDSGQATDSAAIEVIVNQQGDWWMFGREATHNRRSPFTGPSTNALKWSYTTGDNVFSSAAIAADGTVYIGSLDNKLYAFNPDGTLK